MARISFRALPRPLATAVWMMVPPMLKSASFHPSRPRTLLKESA